MVYKNAVPENSYAIGDRDTGADRVGLGVFNLVLDSEAYDFPVTEGTIWWDGSAGTRYFKTRRRTPSLLLWHKFLHPAEAVFALLRLVDASI